MLSFDDDVKSMPGLQPMVALGMQHSAGFMPGSPAPADAGWR